MTTKSGVKAAQSAEPDTSGPAGTEDEATTTKRRPARKQSGTAASTAASTSRGRTSTRAAGKAANKTAATPRKTRSADETEKIRTALNGRLSELRTEYDNTMAELTDLQRDRLTDSAGDDQADTGTKTFEREQEISLANGIRDRITQVERALERLDGGHYGYCERCGNPIPAERLAAFPSATLCVSCKQLEERR